MDGRLELALILANETGHLLGALRHLRWSDVDLDAGRIRWRAEHDKIGFEHATPISPVLSDALSAPIRRAKFRAGGGFFAGSADACPAFWPSRKCCHRGAPKPRTLNPTTFAEFG